MPDLSSLQQLFQNVISKYPQMFQQGVKNITPTANMRGIGAPAQDPAYLQGAVNEYMRQQGLRKQQLQLNQQKKGLEKQKSQPPQPQAQPPAPSGAPQSQLNTSAPFMSLFSNLMSKLQ